MPAEKVMKTRTAFKNFINYLQAEMIDFDKVEQDGMMEVYFKAMQFVGEVAGNTSYSPFYKEDGELLLAVERNIMSMEELSELTGADYRSLAPKMNKLINLGTVSSTKEKRKTFYKITPFGLKYLEALVQDENSVLYSE